MWGNMRSSYPLFQQRSSSAILHHHHHHHHHHRHHHHHHHHPHTAHLGLTGVHHHHFIMSGCHMMHCLIIHTMSVVQSHLATLIIPYPTVAVGIFLGPLSRFGSEDRKGGARILQSCLLGSWLNGIDDDDGNGVGDVDQDGVDDNEARPIQSCLTIMLELLKMIMQKDAEGCWRMLKDVEGENNKFRFYFQMYKWSHLSIWESWKWLRLEVN